MNEVAERYFRWISHSALSPELDRNPFVNVRSKLREMHKYTFSSRTDMDMNREEDGIELRYRFGRSLGIPDPEIAYEIDIYPCSMLEMTAALALKAGEQIFGNPLEKEGARWIFQKMLHNSGMLDLLDPGVCVNDICDRIEDRAYGPDGKGGLFYIPKCPQDLRRVELWHQMMLYLDVAYDEFMESVNRKS